MRVFLLFLIIFNFSLIDSQALAISWFEYQGIKNISNDIVKNFPPDQYIYIGVGASPTAVIAFIEAIFGVNQVIHLPLSGTSSLRKFDLDSEEHRKNYEDNLRLHFDKFLSQKKIEKKKILLIDFANTGEGLIYAFDKVSAYFHEKGSPQVVEAFGLARNHVVESRLIDHNIHSRVLSWFMRGLFVDQVFDEYRKYDPYRPSFKAKSSYYSGPHIITNQLKAERFADIYRRSGYHDADLKELTNDPEIHRNLKTYPNLIKEMDHRIANDSLLKVFMEPLVNRRPNPLGPYCRQLFYLPL